MDIKYPEQAAAMPAKAIKLQFDPINPDQDFTSFGIVSFLQNQVDSMLGFTQKLDTGNSPGKVRPSADQRSLLSTLASGYSILQRGTVSSGKSLALIIYALNLSFSRVPAYGMVRHKPRIDSILVVATDEMLKKYKSLMILLLKNAPTNPCPHRLINTQSKNTFEISRSSLDIQFIDGIGEWTIYSTNPEKKKHDPQIIVTSLFGLLDIIDDPRLTGVKFFAVDDADLFLKASNVNGQPVIYKKGEKNRYTNNLEKCIQKLQAIQFDTFVSEMDERIVKDKNRFLSQDHDRILIQKGVKKSDNEMDQGENKTFDKNQGDNKNGIKVLENDPALSKRESKIRRQILYKPLQFCFVAAPENIHKEILYLKSSTDRQMDAQENIILRIEASSTCLVQDIYSQYIIAKNIHSCRKGIDPLLDFVTKSIQFNNDQRQIKRQETPLITAGHFALSPSQTTTLPLVTFTLCSNSGKESSKPRLQNLDILTNMPNIQETLEHMDNHVKLARNDVKTFDKMFLEFHQRPLKDEGERFSPQVLHLFISGMKIRSDPLVVVIPTSICTQLYCERLNVLWGLDTFITLDKNSIIDDAIKDWLAIENKTLVISASQLVGSTIKNCAEMIVVGFESLLPQTALTSNLMDECVKGILDPSDDWFTFFLSKIQSFPCDRPKRLHFLIDNCSWGTNRVGGLGKYSELKRLSQILMYNDISKKATIGQMVPESTLLEYGIDIDYVKDIKPIIPGQKITKLKK